MPVKIGLMRELGDIAKFDMFRSILDNGAFVFQPSTLRIPIAPGSKKSRKVGIGEAINELDIYYKMLPHADETQQAIMKAHIFTLEKGIKTATELAGDAPEGFQRMPNHHGYGVMAGTYVKKSIRDDLVSMFQITENSDYRGYDEATNTVQKRLMAFWKTSKVAFNVPTIMRNTFSNPWQLSLSGMSYHGIVQKMSEAAYKMSIGHKDYTSAGESGVFSGTWSQAEIQNLLRATNDIEKNFSKTKNLDLAIRSAFSKVAGAYGKIDEFYKFTKYLDGKAKGLDDLDSAIEAQKWVMDYSLVSPMTRVLREKWWGVPFITYQQKILPLIAEAAWERPWRLLVPWAVTEAMTQRMLSESDINEEEWGLWQVAMGEKYADSNALLLLPTFKDGKMKLDEHGRPQIINLEYALPWSFWHEASQNFLAGDLPKLRANMGTTPLAVAMTVLQTGVMPTMDGGAITIWDENDTPWEKAKGYIEFVYNMAMPSMLGTYGAVANMFRDKTLHEIQTTTIQDWSKFSGFTIKPIDAPKGFRRASKEFSRRITDIGIKQSVALKKLPKLKNGKIDYDSEAVQAIVEKYLNKTINIYREVIGPLESNRQDETGRYMKMSDFMDLTDEALQEHLKLD